MAVTRKTNRVKPAEPRISAEALKRWYTDMLLIRRFEERAGQMYGMGLIGGFCHLYIGQEAIATGLMHIGGDKTARGFEVGENRSAFADRLEIIDVEVFLDGSQATIHHLRREECDYRPLVSTLSKKHDLLVVMSNLAQPQEPEGKDEHGGCGKPG